MLVWVSAKKLTTRFFDFFNNIGTVLPKSAVGAISGVQLLLNIHC